MKIYAALGLAALITGFGAAGAHAQGSIYVYNFNDGVTGSSPANQTNLFTVDRINQGGAGSSLVSSFDAAGITSFGGTKLNADNGDVAGQALALVNQTNNGHSLTAFADLTGFQNIGFSFAGQRTATGFNNDTLAYSLDNINFTTIASGIDLPTAFGVQNYDLSSITAINNAARISFRLTFDGATSSSGNNRLDNLIISGTKMGGITPVSPVPEASTTVSLGLMLALGGLAFTVKKKKAGVAL